MAGLTLASIRPARANSSMSAEALLSAAKVVSFRMQVSRTTRKVGPGAPQRPCASVGFDERNRLGFGHGPAAVLAVRARQRRGQVEPDNLAANDGRRIHNVSVREASRRHKRSGPCIPAAWPVIRPDETAQPDVQFLAERLPAI